jgi:HrpA-like RNA helicase
MDSIILNKTPRLFNGSRIRCRIWVTQKTYSKKYYNTLKQRQDLPVSKLYDDIIKAYLEPQVIVVCAETGLGKTTQIPQLIALVERKSTDKIVVCTQPRRHGKN